MRRGAALLHWTCWWNHLAQGHCLAVPWLRQRTIDDTPALEAPTTRAPACSRSSSWGLVRRACWTRGASWCTSLRTREPQVKERLNRPATTSQVTSRSGHLPPPAPATQKDRLAAQWFASRKKVQWILLPQMFVEKIQSDGDGALRSSSSPARATVVSC